MFPLVNENKVRTCSDSSVKTSRRYDRHWLGSSFNRLLVDGHGDFSVCLGGLTNSAR